MKTERAFFKYYSGLTAGVRTPTRPSKCKTPSEPGRSGAALQTILAACIVLALLPAAFNAGKGSELSRRAGVFCEHHQLDKKIPDVMSKLSEYYSVNH